MAEHLSNSFVFLFCFVLVTSSIIIFVTSLKIQVETPWLGEETFLDLKLLLILKEFLSAAVPESQQAALCW